MHASRSAVIAVTAVTLTMAAAACGKTTTSPSATVTTAGASGAPTTAGAASPAAAGTIDIHQFMFQPSPAHAKVGATITVTNKDSTDHSLTAIDGSFDTGVFSSGSKTITLTKAGTFSIHCRIHNFMTGTIIVAA